ncbi:site-2 protease family protein [Olsenella sp. YH-ols2217]|uniref:Site-2 protease family protein n=1 Tax=Kribbibacterium absianum TaxID=3044210 RepID=A0ABT6ZIY1_9ACTN|nr:MULTISPECIES: site-2 protease family protein [unclassified Olsenella]MDJ1121515.1 site-2 protease family protein [Olsenella sp. YH-ols2216]MDJ1129005.1 site-2 protease family protein [Olsenella sp. YH-ols2217]
MLAGIGGALASVFWGLLLLSVLVFIHEGGHFMAARALKIRVKDFYLGLPCRFNLHVESKRYGTDYGVTPVLLGGYTMVCGMDSTQSPHLAEALAFVMERGRASIAETAEHLGCSEEDALTALVCLTDWASIEPFYDPALGEKPNQSTYPQQFQTVARDGSLRTKYDKGHDFALPGSTEAGQAHPLTEAPEEFLAHEREHTYVAHGFWGRTFVLVAGVVINILCGLLLVVLVLTLAGVSVTVDEPQIGAVQEGSPAAAAGLEAGDVVETVNGEPVDSWTSLVSAVRSGIGDGARLQITYHRSGSEATREVTVQVPDGETTIGISAPTERVRLSVGEALGYAASYVGATAVYISQLFQPSHAAEVIENSTSVVGISVMASQAASQGIASFALLAAAVSLSLGFMNLLPVPPLDGGKIVIEAIQAALRRPVSMKVQTALSYVGICLFMLLFFVLLRQDVIRFVVGG